MEKADYLMASRKERETEIERQRQRNRQREQAKYIPFKGIAPVIDFLSFSRELNSY